MIGFVKGQQIDAHINKCFISVCHLDWHAGTDAEDVKASISVRLSTVSTQALGPQVMWAVKDETRLWQGSPKWPTF